MSGEAIPVALPHMPHADQITPYLRRIDETHIYSNSGPLAREFADRVQGRVNSPHVWSTTSANATLALTAAVATSSSNSGQVWKVPTWTFAATPLAIQLAGRTMSFVDVSPDSWESDIPAQDVPGIHVLPFGAALRVEQTDQRWHTPLIVDAAASFASLDQFQLPTDRVWLLVLSTHATKTLGSGEGAIVISNDESWIQDITTWSNFGFWGTRDSRIAGTNAKMSEYHAAVGLASLDAWESTREQLRNVQVACRDATERLHLAVHPALRRDEWSNYWIVQFPHAAAKSLAAVALEAEGIGYRDWWSQGAHRMPAFATTPREGELRHSESLAATTLGLPCFVGLGPEQMTRISAVIERSQRDG